MFAHLGKNFADEKGINIQRVWEEIGGITVKEGRCVFKSRNGNFWNVFQHEETKRIRKDGKIF